MDNEIKRQVRRSRIEERKRKKNRIKIILSYIILFIIVSMLSYMSYGIYKEAKVRTINSDNRNENSANLYSENYQNELENQTNKSNKEFIKVDEQYMGYEVDSRLEIPKIKLNTNVLAKYSTEGLKICASKYYGSSPNEIGNYCIAAHNYNKENMFNHIIDLEEGDSIFLTDNNNGKIEYRVYDKYKVKPQNVKPLSQETQGKREITLITCVNYSQNRLIIKAASVD